ncbi:hypothetical protein K3N28_11770 [Glycomyces sp. TRM65418]|uniref:hypothetical protein n=1 Tax=Glycomyces sp. TRM65418 TaxID=2867006 RepID=UPI001CE56E7D|nr:hypothetical protein [Glycomyces sp. TRM65418]MCC3763744.1 hypothetical protein [Glycomyces sp. TRM65418]QZD53455.1 hypothetical protein K3N28_11705 [Glycomyces sp. TRM65418]
MKFTLEVDLDQIDPERRETELGRILRYWAGNLQHYALERGDRAELADSEYRTVGEWRITA